ncbi:MAG: hypothetical protein QXG81_02110 [Ignisphaera sp.]
MRKIHPALIGILIGAFTSFVNSYSYAVSGYTTSEISIVWIPILSLFIFKLLNVDYSVRDIVISFATAIGIDITTTLTSGMYITYGFLKNVAFRLKPFGFDVDVPKYLFNYGKSFIDLNALPIYITLAISTLGGAFIAYSLRSHFLDKERLKYPIATASAVITNLMKEFKVGRKFLLLIFALGFATQMTFFIAGLSIDLTPVTSMFLPGSVFAISFTPIVFALFLLLPLSSLRSFFMGSFLTYLVFIPIAIKLFSIPLIPSQTYDDMLFSVSPIVLGINVGFVITFLLYYLIKYWTQLAMSFSVILKFGTERVAFAIGLSYIAFLGIIATVFAVYLKPINNIVFLAIILALFLHLILIIGNLRVVGESGTGSQALFPLVTIVMYSLGVRNTMLYAVLDPYTGIPMPQTISATTMNLLRYSRLNKVNAMETLKYFCLGVAIGSFITYTYGNLLVGIYGFNSPQMPLSKWIPTTVWMAAVYQGKLAMQSLSTILFASLISILIIIFNRFIGLALFPFLVGITLPPDIGFQILLAYIVKSIVVRFGPTFHERLIVGATIFMLGCAVALIANIILISLGVASP